MAFSKVILNGTTLMDVTDKTVTSASMLDGITALKNDGTSITGSIQNGSATTPSTSISASPTISVDSSTGIVTASVNKVKTVTPVVSPGYITSGTYGIVTVSGSNTEQLTTQGATTYTPTTSDQTIASGKYLTGPQTILGSASLLPENIKKNITIFGVTGTYDGGGGGSSYTLVTSKEVAVSTTTTTATKVLDISGTFSLTKFVYVCVRDKAGKRNGYFYGSDTMFLPVTASGVASTRNANRRAYYVDDSGNLVAYSLTSATSGVAGVYATNRATSNVEISSGYSSSNTRTIDGTYTVSVYEIDYPTGLSPF